MTPGTNDIAAHVKDPMELVGVDAEQEACETGVLPGNPRPRRSGAGLGLINDALLESRDQQRPVRRRRNALGKDPRISDAGDKSINLSSADKSAPG
jgi:hypothetical protein